MKLGHIYCPFEVNIKRMNSGNKLLMNFTLRLSSFKNSKHYGDGFSKRRKIFSMANTLLFNVPA